MTLPRTRKRFDIQGLRAVAVLLVVFEHIFGQPVGGFVGVDVFFVISGFLITGLLIAERERTGRISLRDFYVRRVRRLMPAAIVVIGLTLITAFALLPLPRVLQAVVDAGWSVVFLANWHFAAQDTDYFASGGPTSPFQHFWSLSVEEQFYLVVPVLLLVVLGVGTARSGRWLGFGLMSVLTVASLGWAVLATASDPSASYFSSTVRAWELGFGAMIAFGAPIWLRIPTWLGALAAWVGLVAILVASIMIDGTAAFPGPLALIPVVGAALVLIGGAAQERSAPFILRTRPMVAIGNVSYSLYLWHFPIYILAVSIDASAAWIALPLSLAAAFVTFHLVEQPGMHWRPHGRQSQRKRSSKRRAGASRDVRISALGGVLVVAAVLSLIAADRLRPVEAPPAVAAEQPTTADESTDEGVSDEHDEGPARTALTAEITQAISATGWPELEQDPGASIAGGEHLSCGDVAKPQPRDACTFGPEGARRTMMLVGDSTAVHELDAFVRVAESESSDWRLVSRVGFACSFMDVDIRVDTLEACRAYRQQTLDAIEEIRPDVLVVTNSFASLALAGTNRDVTTAEWSDGLGRYLDRVRPAVGRIVHVTPPPAEKSIETCYRPGGSPTACLSRPNPTWKERLAAVQGRLDSTDVVVDTRPLFCVQDICPAFVGNTVVKKDFVHLTGAYAVKMAPALRELLEAGGATE